MKTSYSRQVWHSCTGGRMRVPRCRHRWWAYVLNDVRMLDLESGNRIGASMKQKGHSLIKGSWLAVVTISSPPTSAFHPSHPQPLPWIPAVFPLNAFLKLSRLPNVLSMAAVSFGADEGLAADDEAGTRLAQNRVWLMWPIAWIYNLIMW